MSPINLAHRSLSGVLLLPANFAKRYEADMSHHGILGLGESLVNGTCYAYMVNGARLKGCAGDVTHSSVREGVGLCQSCCIWRAIPNRGGLYCMADGRYRGYGNILHSVHG